MSRDYTFLLSSLYLIKATANRSHPPPRLPWGGVATSFILPTECGLLCLHLPCDVLLFSVPISHSVPTGPQSSRLRSLLNFGFLQASRSGSGLNRPFSCQALLSPPLGPPFWRFYLIRTPQALTTIMSNKSHFWSQMCYKRFIFTRMITNKINKTITDNSYQDRLTTINKGLQNKRRRRGINRQSSSPSPVACCLAYNLIKD